MLRWIGAIVVPVVLAVAARADAAVVFGANLEAAPASSSFRCEGPLPPFGAFSGQPTCTAFSSGRFGDGAGSHLVPNGVGVVTRIDVRMPGATGPMQITVLRAQRHAQSSEVVCCRWVGESQVFTPTPDTITSVPVRLPVRSELTPTNIYEFDAVAISALTRDTPMPAAPVSGMSSGGYFPHVSQAQKERFEQQASLGENQIMLRAFWEPDANRDGFGDETQQGCGGAGRAVRQCPAPGGSPPPVQPVTPTGTSPTTTTGALGPPAPLKLGSSTARVADARTTVRLTCGTQRCRGTLRLQNRRTGTRRTTFASTRFDIAAGGTRSLRLSLTAAGRAALRGKNSLSVWANVTGTPRLSVRLKLKR